MPAVNVVASNDAFVVVPLALLIATNVPPRAVPSLSNARIAPEEALTAVIVSVILFAPVVPPTAAPLNVKTSFVAYPVPPAIKSTLYLVPFAVTLNVAPDPDPVVEFCEIVA